MGDTAFTATCGNCDQVGSGLDPIGNDPAIGWLEFINAGDGQAIGIPAINFCAHAVEHIDQIADFRFPGGVLDNRHPLGKHRRHHQVFGASDGRNVKVDDISLHPAGDLSINIAALETAGNPQTLQTGDMKINWPGTNGAASRQRHLGLTQAGEQRPKNQDGSPHRLHQIIGSLRIDQITAINGDDILLAMVANPEVFHKLQEGSRITQIRNVTENMLARGK